MPRHYITVSDEVYKQLQSMAQPFRTRDKKRLDTPDKVIKYLLDENTFLVQNLNAGLNPLDKHPISEE